MIRRKRFPLIRVDDEIKSKMFDIKKDMEKIEGKDLSYNEVLKRIMSGEDIPKRLKEGSFERKFGLK